MSPAILIGIVAATIAVIAYSIGVWGAFRAKGARVRDLVLLWVGVVFDIVATAAMSSTLGWRFENSVHTWVALVAFFGMLIVAAIGTWAYAKERADVLAPLAKWSLAPWALWVGLYIWGFVARMPQR